MTALRAAARAARLALAALLPAAGRALAQDHAHPASSAGAGA